MLDFETIEKLRRESDLTIRQIEIIYYVASGFLSKEIAEALDISIMTVNRHRNNIISKMGFRTEADFARYAVAYGIIKVNLLY